MPIRIITDSASDLTFLRRKELTILPMTITFGNAVFQDGVSLSHREFYEKLMGEKSLPVTSQINPAQFEAAFRTAVERGEDVIAIVLSSKLSGTYQSACIAAEDHPGRVFVVDSLNATVGEAILVQRAIQLMDAGLDAPAIAALLTKERKQIRLVALLDTLEYLQRGGRLSKSAAIVGGILSIKPVVAVVEGEVKVLGKARGAKNGSNLLIQQIQSTSGIDFDRPFLLGYTGLDDRLLQKYISDSAALWEGRAQSLPQCTVGATIGTHVGPGAIAVAFFCKE